MASWGLPIHAAGIGVQYQVLLLMFLLLLWRGMEKTLSKRPVGVGRLSLPVNIIFFLVTKLFFTLLSTSVFG